MTRTRSVHLASLLSFVGVVLFLTWLSERPGDNARSVRMLNDQEMFAAFGDNPTFEQPVEYNCSKSFAEGTTKCVYCGSRNNTIDKRKTCCPCGAKAQSGQCDYLEETRVCVDLKRYTAPILGNPGSCKTCTAAGEDRYEWDGSTCNIAQADGQKCQ